MLVFISLPKLSKRMILLKYSDKASALIMASTKNESKIYIEIYLLIYCIYLQLEHACKKPQLF